MKRPPANHEIVTIAVYLLGGDSEYVDTEDIAVKASKLAPQRFAWRKYPQQISLDAVRKRLWDAQKSEKGAYLIGSEKTGWSLTAKGVAFAKENLALLGVPNLTRRPLSQREKRWTTNERARMLSTPLYRQGKQQEVAEISFQEAERFMNLNDYITGKARERRIERVVNLFRDDPELGPIIDKVVRVLREGNAE